MGIYSGTYVTSGGTYVTNIALRGQVTVPAGTNAYYNYNFYWVQLDPPLLLSANSVYVLAGQGYNADGDVWQDASVSGAGMATWNGCYVGTSTARGAVYGPGGTTWPLSGTTIFTRNGLSKAYVQPMMANLPQGPAKVALTSTNTQTLTGGATLTVNGFGSGRPPSPTSGGRTARP